MGLRKQTDNLFQGVRFSSRLSPIDHPVNVALDLPELTEIVETERAITADPWSYLQAPASPSTRRQGGSVRNAVVQIDTRLDQYPQYGAIARTSDPI